MLLLENENLDLKFQNVLMATKKNQRKSEEL